MKQFGTLITIIIFGWSTQLALSQNTQLFHKINKTITSDTLFLDSLSIIPSSIIIFDEQAHLISPTLYKVNSDAHAIIVDKLLLNKTLSISFRTFNTNFSKSQFGSLYYIDVKTDSSTSALPSNIFSPLTGDENNSWDDNQLNKSGYISRGIDFGNNQDVVVNSALNMQLNGQLSDGIYIKAAITDNNIPIQPDGNTQQIQEFDKVYISLYNDKSNLTLGDFELNKPIGYFLNYHKKVMGGMVEHRIDGNKNNHIKLKAAGAVSKGRFNRLEINAKEGVQGPYQLKGAQNESYIVVLAGTEKVYIDGEFQKRGEDNDYTIDYNLAEVSFTTHRIITKDSRIVVEFEYADKNFAKFTVAGQVEYESKNSNFWINFLSDHESKNQPINADYTDTEKQILSNAGDDPFKAVVSSIDSLGFSSEEVRYTLVDTLGYDSVLVYSTIPGKAIYRATFAFVGEGNGNYKMATSSANGRVFEWIAPVNGQAQGAYLPVKILTTTKSQQMLSTGGKIRLASFTTVNYEIAGSRYDANTFSNFDSGDDWSYAMKLKLEQDLLIKDTSQNKLLWSVFGEQVAPHFKSFEPFQNVEFKRDWNLTNYETDYRSIGTALLWKNRELWQLRYENQWLLQDSSYSGWKQNINAQTNIKKWLMQANASWLKSKQKDFNTDFLRSDALIQYQLSNMVKLGVKEKSENNLWKSNDSLLAKTSSFFEWQAFADWQTKKQNTVFVQYSNRQDKGAKEGLLNAATVSHMLSADYQLNSLKSQSLIANLTWRQVEIQDSTISLIHQNEQNFLGKIEHQIKGYKNAINFRTFYELSTGLELKKEFAYVEVAAGQGIYQWIDYNGNGVQELDEFEKASYSDEAKYIRVYLPSSEYIRAYANEFSETVQLHPYKVWRNNTGFLKWVSRWSNILSYKVKKKLNNNEAGVLLNPFSSQVADSSLLSLSQSYRNTLSFNKISSIWGIDYIYLNYKNKNLLMQGFESRTNLNHTIASRVNVSKSWRISNETSFEEKTYLSEYFSSNNYKIEQWSSIVEISFQANDRWRFSSSYQYKDKQNLWDIQAAIMQKIGIEIKYNLVSQSNIQINVDFFQFDYNTATNNTIAFEMLEGMMPGKNGKWTAVFQTQLSKYLQLNLSYLGRVAEDSKVVHTGQAQLRAFF